MCNCPKCDWRIISKTAISIPCPMCKTRVDCDGEPAETRIERVKQSTARKERLRNWIAFFRVDGEIGLGDTVQRLKALAGKRAIKEDLRQIEQICSCETSVAIAKLNELYPYPTDAVPLSA